MQSELFSEAADFVEEPYVIQLEAHEGFRAKPYKDSRGFLTIGFGVNLEQGLSKDEARLLMVYRIEKLVPKLGATIKEYGLQDGEFWTDARIGVMVNMCYNLGHSGLLKFKRMFAALKEKDAEKAAAEMLNSVWADQVGYRAKELAEQMRTGEYPEKYKKGE